MVSEGPDGPIPGGERAGSLPCLCAQRPRAAWCGRWGRGGAGRVQVQRSSCLGPSLHPRAVLLGRVTIKDPGLLSAQPCWAPPRPCGSARPPRPSDAACSGPFRVGRGPGSAFLGQALRPPSSGPRPCVEPDPRSGALPTLPWAPMGSGLCVLCFMDFAGHWGPWPLSALRKYELPV